ncbi:transglutaminase TgpA family protein [Streptomyces sp. H27-D2]|uniref:transglutaminase TgpA family protein n=1 Tax=Streptomyces sp. H27-D2 TaxID=3046304 RepID=UPI002DB74C72|nr:DUF3488 and transglutaminase-like domain-containing protein [Streptomyces sp. H27-D2]MEC4018925.1 DUF3488 and transglutaminase-like domain-containing protein [Streptomyces sp. H27-D2]
MSGRGRLTVCAAVATLLAACALLPLMEQPGWMIQAVLLLTLLSAAGAVARRVPLARPLTVAVQALLALLLLTLVFARGQAVGGVLPGPDVIREFSRLIAQGSDDVGRFAIPAPVTPGIRLLLVGGVLVIGLAVDALAVTYRSAAPAGLPLLALYSVAAGLSRGGADWFWFLLAGSGYLLLLLAEGRDRLSQWGRVFSGGGPRKPGRPASGPDAAGPPTPAPVRTGRRIGALALGVSLVVPAMLPSLGGGLIEAAGNGSGDGSGGTISAVNPLVSLQNSLNQPEDRQVLSYRTSTDQTQDLYLRIVALDQFDGTSWKPSERHIYDVPDPLPSPLGLNAGVATTTIDTSVSAADWYRQNWLPLPYPASDVDVNGRWRFEPAGRTIVGDRGQNTRGAQYRVKSLLVQPTAAQLAAARPPPSDLMREYTKVPDSLPDVVRDTAKKLAAGSDNAYEKAVKIQDWFAVNGGFTYNTSVRAGSGSDAIARFLEQKEGFCVHFAFSMAAMSRTLGIPARVAVGFTPGTRQSDGSMSVGLKDAHAWPELYFEGVGWTRFEPTPSRGTAPDYTLADTPAGNGSDAAVPRPSDSAAPSAEPSNEQSCTPEMKKLDACGAPAAQAGGGSSDPGLPLGPIAATAALVLLVLLVPVLPLLWRVRARSRRLHGGPDAGDASARTLAAWRELTDSAWDYGVLPDESQTPRKAVARIVRIGELDDPAAESAHRVAAAVEQVLYAPRPRPVAGLADDVRRVRDGLGGSAGRRLRLRALLAPRSAVRVVWAGSRRWTALVERGHAGRWAGSWRRLIPRRLSGQRG